VPSLHGGGAERSAATLCNEWVLRGHRVTLVTLARSSTSDFKLDSSVTCIALDLLTPSSTALNALLNNSRRVIALRHVLATCRIDVVLGMMTTCSILSFIASVGLRTRAIAAERIYPPMSPPGRAWQALRRLTYPRMSAVVSQTRKGAAWIELHCPGSRTGVVPNAVPWPLPAYDPALPTQGLIGERKTLLAAGRLARQKGFDLLLDAFATIASRHAEWDVVILGEGIERGTLIEQARALGIASRVRLPGVAGNMSDWYARADLFVMSSRFEGFPNALLEAMASGCPVISFDCDTGPSDIIRPGLDGVLVAVAEGHAGLAREMDHLMRCEPRRVDLGRHAVEVQARFSPEKVMEQWESLLNDVAKD
jgi:glycosyltransferase involved in cell wall biosynthesis